MYSSVDISVYLSINISYNSLHIFFIYYGKRCLKGDCILNCLMLIIPCFLTLCHSTIPTSYYISNVFITWTLLILIPLAVQFLYYLSCRFHATLPPQLWETEKGSNTTTRYSGGGNMQKVGGLKYSAPLCINDIHCLFTKSEKLGGNSAPYEVHIADAHHIWLSSFP